MSKRKFSDSIRGKGYYIALILCAVAIGISGYLYYRNANQEPQLQNPPAVTDPAEANPNDVQAVATQPADPSGDPGTEPSSDPTAGTAAPTQGTQGKPSLQTAAPLAGEAVGEYAMDCLAYNQTTRDWRTHDGIDIAAEAGTQVCAAAQGTVYTVYEDETMGTVVVIRHADGYTTRYASLAQEVLVAPGDTVKLGQAIGCVGQTALLEAAMGDHLHFSVTCDGETVDPAAFLSPA